MSDTPSEVVPTPEPEAKPGRSEWDALLGALHSRFPTASPRILFCINALQQDNAVSLDDLKALAQLHGLHVTGASLKAARRLITPPARRAAEPGVDEADDPGPTRRARLHERIHNEASAEGLEQRLRYAVRQMTADADAKVERMRAAILKAIDVLREAIE